MAITGAYILPPSSSAENSASPLSVANSKPRRLANAASVYPASPTATVAPESGSITLPSALTS